MDLEARKGAQATWGYRECGTVEGDFHGYLDYFHVVERKRYEAYPWLQQLLEETAFRFNGKRVLEIGPGQGTDLVQFARAGAECAAVDITEAHLQSTARNFGCRGLRAPDLYKVDATNLPYGRPVFDLVFSNGVLHHIPEADRVVAEVKRVLNPSGLFVFLVYNKWSWFALHKALTAFVDPVCLWKPWTWKFNLFRAIRLGWDGWLSTLEEGADGKERKPYIKLYTVGDLSRLLGGWEWSSHTYCGSPMPDSLTGRSLGGWFHVVYARRP